MFTKEDNVVGINDFTDSGELYYKSLERHKPLSREEERDLLIKAQNGDIKSRNKILESNLRFVYSIAKKYRGRGVDISDLISAGNEGMIYALERFDINRNVKFFSYAVWKIRQNMQLLVKEYEDKDKVEIAIEEFANDDFIEDYQVTDYDEDVSNNKWDIEDADAIFLKNEDKEQKSLVVNALLKTLSEREKVVIKMFFGINEEEHNYSLEEISKTLQLSTERVRQIKLKAIQDMRCSVFDVEAADFLFN